MLHKETVKPGTLALINRLMKDQLLNPFYLVGGTALALRLGHRESIDIDLFNSTDFDAEKLALHLREIYGAQIKRQKSNYLSGNIGNVDFDIITHPYQFIKPLQVIKGIRMVSNADIAAMKINAIVNSGQRVKDFIDIHYLLKEFSCKNIIDFYCRKYPNVDPAMARASLLYHDDIDFNMPVIIKDKSLKWEVVKKGIVDAITEYDKVIQHQEFVEKLKEAVTGHTDESTREITNDDIVDRSIDFPDADEQEYRGPHR